MRYCSTFKRAFVDRPALVLYFGLISGCGGGPPALVLPAGGTPSTAGEAESWARESRDGALVLHRFRWQYRDRNEAGGGRGSARITPGDSLRLDMSGPLGAGRGAAFVIGDQQQWAEPEEEVRKVAPSFPLLWAMLGIVRIPEKVESVTRFDAEGLVAWRFVSGADTVEIARMAGPPVRLMADYREGGVRVGRVETTFTEGSGLKTSRLDVPSAEARLQLNYYETTRPKSFPPEVWRQPERQP